MHRVCVTKASSSSGSCVFDPNEVGDQLSLKTTFNDPPQD